MGAAVRGFRGVVGPLVKAVVAVTGSAGGADVKNSWGRERKRPNAVPELEGEAGKGVEGCGRGHVESWDCGNRKITFKA
jgi:hypothetical protein